MTAIEWTDKTWNPTVGCSRVSAGCEHCYAERFAHREIMPAHEGLTVDGPKGPRWTGEVRLLPERLDQPLRWRKPRRIFVDSMSDLFHESVPDEFIAKVWDVMRATPRHTYQILTKRPERMAKILPRLRFDGFANDRKGHVWVAEFADAGGYPLAHGHRGATGLVNVWLGTSIENQPTADERIPHLLQTPAAVRFVSAEPLLGPIDFCHIRSWHPVHGPDGSDALSGGSWGHPHVRRMAGSDSPGYCNHSDAPILDQVIVGGESGPGARPCSVEWIRSIVEQCKAASVPVFVKQLGARPFVWAEPEPAEWLKLQSRKGADMSEWPEDLRVREMPSCPPTTSGQRLRALRLSLGCTQKKLSERSGISIRAIIYIETGRSVPRQDTKRRLTLALGIPWARHREIFGAAVP